MRLARRMLTLPRADLAGIDRDHQLGVDHHRRRREGAGAAGGEHDLGGAGAAAADPIGITGEDRDRARLVDGDVVARRRRFVASQALELAGGAIDAHGGGDVEAEVAQAIGA